MIAHRRYVVLAIGLTFACGDPTAETAPPVPVPSPDLRQPPHAPAACTTDLDCDTAASCWAERCVPRDAAVAPCSADSECEVRQDDAHCDLFAALRSAPRDDRPPGRGCGGRPAPHQYAARCDASAHRCVLERASAPRPPPDLACEADADCRVLLLACGCTCFARHVDAPVGDALFDAMCGGRPMQNCGVANPCAERSATCDASTHRCVLEAP